MQRNESDYALMTKNEIQQIHHSTKLKKERILHDINHIFQILADLNILIDDLRRKVIEETLKDENNIYSSVLEGLKLLKSYHCLDAGNAEAFIQYKPCGGYLMAHNLIKLSQLQLSTPKHRELCGMIADPHHYIPEALRLLSEINLLNDTVYQYLKDDIDILVSYHSPSHHYYRDFRMALMLTKYPTVDLVKQTLKNIRKEMIYAELKKMNLYNHENILCIQHYPQYFKELYYFLNKLSQAKLGNQRNFETLVSNAEHLHQFLEVGFYNYGTFKNLLINTRETWINDDIIKQIKMKGLNVSALSCAQFQHASHQHHLVSRMPDEILKNIYSYVAPIAHDKDIKKHFLNNLFKLPKEWTKLPSQLFKNKYHQKVQDDYSEKKSEECRLTFKK